MWIADSWKDYQVLDTSDGEKLELWGGYKLIRPDPQVIWKTPRGREWRNPNGHYHRAEENGKIPTVITTAVIKAAVSGNFGICPKSGRSTTEISPSVSNRLTSNTQVCFRNRQSTGIGSAGSLRTPYPQGARSKY